MTGEEKTTREMIIETNRDVKWICRLLAEMKETDSGLEERVRDLEAWQSVKTGEDMRSHGVSAGVGAGAGGLVAVLVKLIGGGGLG